MADTKQQDKERIKARRPWLKVKYIAALVIYYGIIVLAIVWLFPVDWWLLWGILLAAYIIVMTEKANQDELVAIRLFGRPVWEIEDGGLVHAPWPIADIARAPGTMIYLEIGSPIKETNAEGVSVPVLVDPDLEKVYKVYRMQEPMRISFATPEIADYKLTGGDDPVAQKREKERYTAEDPVHRRLTTDPHLALIYRIDDFMIFLRRVSSVESANQIIRTAGVSAFQQIAGKLTPAMAISYQELINEHVTRVIEIRVGERKDAKEAEKEGAEQRYPYLGIDFASAQVSVWGLPRRINEAQANVGRAGFRAQATRVKAAAEKDRLSEEGRGRAIAKRNEGSADARNRELFLTAEARGLEEQAEVLETEDGALRPGALRTKELETVAAALANGQHNTIVSGSNILGAVASIGDTLNRTKGDNPPAPLPSPNPGQPQ
jgi:hypothetical protein